MVMQGSHITHEVGITHLKIKRGDEKGMDDQKQLVQIKDLFSQWKRLLSVLLGAIVISWGCTKIYPLYSERILNLHLPKTEPVSYTHLTLHSTSRRQRQMCIRDSDCIRSGVKHQWIIIGNMEFLAG